MRETAAPRSAPALRCGVQPAYAHGWYALAFERDLGAPVTPLGFGDQALVAARVDGALQVLDARCPHRGAHLGHGGRVSGACLVCPFHGYRIGAGTDSDDGFAVRRYPTLVHGGVVFARLSDAAGPDLPRALHDFDKGHTYFAGFSLTARTSMEMVMENGFDSAHFRAVHKLISVPALATETGPYGDLLARGRFEIPRSGWHEAPGTKGTSLGAAYLAHAFSPGVVVTELIGDPPFNYKIMTTATPDPGGRSSTVRLTLILPDGPDGAPPNEGFANDLLAASRAGLEQDCVIWDHIDLGAARYVANDQAALAFGDFCAPFRA
jgi:phenylpropionate dioxygenase-like ring-hydroxylating dioxygenase large terminal subunit